MGASSQWLEALFAEQHRTQTLTRAHTKICCVLFQALVVGRLGSALEVGETSHKRVLGDGNEVSTDGQQEGLYARSSVDMTAGTGAIKRMALEEPYGSSCSPVFRCRPRGHNA